MANSANPRIQCAPDRINRDRSHRRSKNLRLHDCPGLNERLLSRTGIQGYRERTAGVVLSAELVVLPLVEEPKDADDLAGVGIQLVQQEEGQRIKP